MFLLKSLCNNFEASVLFLPPPYGIYVEELIVLKENRRLLKAFKRDSEYKIKEGGQNVFGLVEGEEEADNALGEQELEEELGMFYDDLEEEEEH